MPRPAVPGPSKPSRPSTMGELLLIGVAITIEPLPVVGFILVLGSDHARRNGFAFIAAWIASLVAIVAGTLLVTGGQPPLAQQRPGAVERHRQRGRRRWPCWLVAWRVSKRPADRPHKQPAWMAQVDRMSALGAASPRASCCSPGAWWPPGSPWCIEADLHTTATIVVLVLFCLLATSSMATMQTYYLISPDAARERLARLQDWVDRNRDRGIVILVGQRRGGCWPSRAST